MSMDAKYRLKEMVDSYLEKDGSMTVDTGIIASHIAQMKLFGIRQGVEFSLDKITLVINVRILLIAS